METEHHRLNELFRQLGLPDDDAAIESFINEHELPRSQRMTDASFWSDTQAEFLRSAIAEDAEWAEIVDELDTRLHHDGSGMHLPRHWLHGDDSQCMPPFT